MSNNKRNRPYSSLVVDGVEKAAARAMLHAVGFSDTDFDKPQIGIASTWSNLTPCNMHIDTLADAAAMLLLLLLLLAALCSAGRYCNC